MHSPLHWQALARDPPKCCTWNPFKCTKVECTFSSTSVLTKKCCPSTEWSVSAHDTEWTAAQEDEQLLTHWSMLVFAVKTYVIVHTCSTRDTSFLVRSKCVHRMGYHNEPPRWNSLKDLKFHMVPHTLSAENRLSSLLVQYCKSQLNTLETKPFRYFTKP